MYRCMFGLLVAGLLGSPPDPVQEPADLESVAPILRYLVGRFRVVDRRTGVLRHPSAVGSVGTDRHCRLYARRVQMGTRQGRCRRVGQKAMSSGMGMSQGEP
jgi:hypothetical protein